MTDFERKLAQLRENKCAAVCAIEYEEADTDTVYSVGTSIQFTDGTKLRAQFWRLTKEGGPLVSIFDPRQRYGLPAPIDAVRIIREELVGKQVLNAVMDRVTGDLRFQFENDVLLEVFNFTGFEIWAVTFPDGSEELSNYALTANQPSRA
jgi:hypothetical protein